MYFPVLRGKQFELHALRECAHIVAANDVMIPVLEPVKIRPTVLAVDSFTSEGMPFCLIVNPRSGDLSSRHPQLQEEVIDELLTEYENWYPTLYVDKRTTRSEVSRFASRYEQNASFFFLGDVDTDVHGSIVAAEPAFAFFRRGVFPQRLTTGFSISQRVDIDDYFRRQTRNADYPDDEFFTDRFNSIPDTTFGHYGDYSIVGDSYTEGGGAALTVALHHVYYNEPDEDLHVAHFKSDSNDTTDDVAGKFMEALEKLVQTLPEYGVVNSTSATEEYQRLYDEEHFPGLGYAKKLGLKQHFEVMNHVLQVGA